MSNLSEEEIIEILKNQISDYVIGDYCVKCGHYKICNDRNEDCHFIQAIDGILDLYNKEKEMYKYYKDLANSYIANNISKDKIREIKNIADKDNCCKYLIFYEKICELLED